MGAWKSIRSAEGILAISGIGGAPPCPQDLDNVRFMVVSMSHVTLTSAFDCHACVCVGMVCLLQVSVPVSDAEEGQTGQHARRN